MSNFENRAKQPWTTYDNLLIQESTVFENPYQKLCYMYLYSYANAKRIFPSMPAIARAICGSVRTAIRTIDRLEEMGFIEVKRTPGISNEYTALNDYFEIAQKITSDRESLLTESHQTSDTESLPPVTESHPKTTNKTKKENKISSSRNDHIYLVDEDLKKKYPNVPFDEVREALLTDETAVIDTIKQYESMLGYRLRTWKPRRAKTTVKKPVRKEVIPEHMDKPFEPKPVTEEAKAKAKADVMEKINAFRNA
jgi:hypothetical protein